MSNSAIKLEMHADVAVLTLCTSPMNIVTLDLTQLLSKRLDELAADPAVRALVVTGEGPRAFSAGSNLREFPGIIERGGLASQKLDFENATYSKLANFPRPTIAAIEGLAFGGGLELAACADQIVCAETARLSLPEVRLGIFPGSGGTVRVTRRIGVGRAKRMMLLGDPIDAKTALDWGLVDELAPDGAVLEHALALARRFAAGPALALQACKRAIDDTFSLNEEDALAHAIRLIDALGPTADLAEGLQAFFAKRAPVFRDAPDTGKANSRRDG